MEASRDPRSASAVAVAATLLSNSASAVPVATAAVSTSGGIPGDVGPDAPPTAGVNAASVEPKSSGVSDGVQLGINVATAVVGGGFVEVATRVALGGAVKDGVGLGPGVDDAVRVGVTVRVRVAVAVSVLEGVGVIVRVVVAVAVAVRVGVRLAVAESVGVRVGVLEAGGDVTVNEPLLRVRGRTATPHGSLADAADKVRADWPGAAAGSTLKCMSARMPSAMAS